MSHPLRHLAGAAAAALTAAATVVALVPAHAAAPAADTTATLTWTDSQVKVKVTSPKAACAPGRRVFFLINDGGHLNGASGQTNHNGVIGYESSPSYGGTMRAFVGRTSACRPAQSNTVVREQLETRTAARARTSATVTTIENGYRVRVASPQAGCKAGRKVDLIQYLPSRRIGEAFPMSGTTNANGVADLTYELVPRQRGFDTFKVTAFVRGTGACGLGQSNTLTLPLN